MSDEEKRKLSEAMRLYSQKYVLPLYLKDELGNLMFSATLTLVEFKNRFFALTAAHAVPEDYDLNRGLYVVGLEGERNILGLTLVHRFDEIDLVILDFHEKHFGGDRYYFNLDVDYVEELYKEGVFVWAGFPAKKAKDIYKKDAKSLVCNGMNGNLMTIAKSLFAAIPFKEGYILNLEDEYFFGYSDLKNVHYMKEGLKNKGYSYRGMSGGSLCLVKNEIVFPIEEDLFYFIGIGVEHKKDNTVMGIGRRIIIEKIQEIVKTPVELSSVAMDQIFNEQV